MCCQVIPAIALGNESAQLDIFDSHFLRTDTAGQNHFQFIVIRMMSQARNLPHLLFIQIIVQPLKHTVKCHLCRIRDEREDGMVEVIINRFQDVRNQFLTQLFSLLVNIRVTASREVDPLERTGFLLPCLIDLCRTQLSLFTDQEGLSRQ